MTGAAMASMAAAGKPNRLPNKRIAYDIRYLVSALCGNAQYSAFAVSGRIFEGDRVYCAGDRESGQVDRLCQLETKRN